MARSITAARGMKTIVGESKRYLDIDLTNRSFSVFTPSEEDLRDYIGGKGLGLKLLYDRAGRDGSGLGAIDPLGPDNVLAFMMGVFIGTGAPCSARFAGVTRSPLTGIMVASSCGGPFGMACKTAGWDGLLVSGTADAPLVLRIDEGGAAFEEAGELWGLETGEAQGRLVDSPKQGALVIGPAGENGVLYANIRSGNRYLGRGGMGAVMGAKRLKAIVANGRAYSIEPSNPKAFAKYNERARKYINRNPFILGYRAYGTNFGVNPGVDSGYAPVRNFRDRSDERCRALSGEAMAKRYSTKHAGCVPCVINCGHKGTYPDGATRHIPEYETIGLWGGNIMNFDPDLVALWNDRMNELGMDTISCGATASWAMEAAEKGLRPSVLAFGKTDNILGILDDIAHRRGEGADLAEGSRRLATKYGGLDFAVQVKGLEMAAYDPRAGWGQGLNYAVANRGGCHLNAYPIALEAIFHYIPQYTKLSKASWVAFLEDLFSAVNSTQTCQFSAFGYLLEPPVAKYTPKFLLKLAMTLLPDVAQRLLDWSALSGLVSAITGRRLSARAFLMAGRRTHVLERRMNVLMGVSSADDTLPGRFLDEAVTAHRDRSVVPIAALVKAYYRKKGYDSRGLPTAKLLASLGIPAGSALADAYPDALPPGRPIARAYARIALSLVGRAFSAAQRIDPEVRAEFSALPAGFSFALRVHPRGPGIALKVDAGGRLRRRRPGSGAPDVDMRFSSMGSALDVLTFRSSAFEVYAHGGLAISGDLPSTMAIIRALGIVETLLLPAFITRRILKRPYEMPFFRKLGERIALYLSLAFEGPGKE